MLGVCDHRPLLMSGVASWLEAVACGCSMQVHVGTAEAEAVAAAVCSRAPVSCLISPSPFCGAAQVAAAITGSILQRCMLTRPWQQW